MNDANPTLYDRLGGEAGVATLIDRFYDRVVADPELAPFFAKAPMSHIRRMQKEFFAAALDGPQRYSGGKLFAVHTGLRIRPKTFSRYVQVLLETLKALNVSQADLDAVVDRIALYSNDIVTGDSVSQ